ncbi:MAG: integrin alpha [Actinobacteria bacterium]|nr:integrin alpha [Actinomycetota bacterium]
MDLSDVALAFVGAQDGDVAGFAVAIGDLDGDGIADLAVGAPCHAGGADGGGAVHVVYGPLEDGRSIGSADATLVGGQPGDFVGEGLGAADLDGDGDDELIIGAPGPFVGADPVADGCFHTPVQPGVNRPGEAYVIDGGERLAGNLDARRASVAVVSGLAPADFLGLGISVAGDVDGDGDDDLVVGASGPGSPPVGGGSAFLFTDAIDGEVSATSASAQLFGEAPADLAGVTLGGADLDGDGHSDLLVSAPGHALPPPRPGRVYLFHEPPTGAHSLAAADVVLEGEVADDLAGNGLVTGDLIGDASPDLAIGAPGTDTVFVLSGGERRSGTVALADAPVRIDGPAGGSTGYALAVVDLDGDGTRGLAVGRPARGTGDEAGSVAIFEAPEGQLTFADADGTYTGTNGDNAGFSLTAGDLTGDGIQDLVIGAASIDAAGPGAAYVVPGRSRPGRSGDQPRPDTPRPPRQAATTERASSVLPVTGGGGSLGAAWLLGGALIALFRQRAGRAATWCGNPELSGSSTPQRRVKG